MDPATAEKLIAINKQFYQSFADHFSETRGRLQPGVLQVLDDFPPADQVLDLGCGNGLLAREIVSRELPVHYWGADFSPALLEKARQRMPEDARADFLALDITHPNWDQRLPDGTFDIILCFAALHHIPGRSHRLQICHQVHQLLKPEGMFIHSNWQFLKSKRLRERILPWRTINLPEDRVDEGDYLMDWRRGGRGIRYVHHFTEGELRLLAAASDFDIQKTFYSDGKEGNLSIYQYWKPRGNQ